jgi:glycosyltransferase involved in cell wall biosynthesis
MFGMERGNDVPPEVAFHVDPPQAVLRRLYSSCDVFVSTSWAEGCQLPPMEAMACQCAVVATNVGGMPDYTVPGETALVVEPRDVEGMAQAIIGLLKDDDERRQIAHAGYRHIQQFTWDRAVERFESALIRGINCS